MVRLEATRNTLTSLDLQLETLTVEDKFLDIPNSRLENKTISYKNHSYFLFLFFNFVKFFLFIDSKMDDLQSLSNNGKVYFPALLRDSFCLSVTWCFTEMKSRTALSWIYSNEDSI